MMSEMKPQVQAVLWMDQGVLYDVQGSGGDRARILDNVEQTLAFLQDKELVMAVVTDRIAEAVLTDLQNSGLMKYFQKDGHPVQPVIFPSNFYRQHKPGDEGATATTLNTPLTQAFLSARNSLGTDRQHTLAVVDSVENVRNARSAGLAVIGMAGARLEDPLAIGDVQARMVDNGAFFAASAAIDLPAAVMHFRPPYEAKWQPIAAPGGSR